MEITKWKRRRKKNRNDEKGVKGERMREKLML